MLQLNSVTFYRGKKCILDNASAMIHATEKVGIVGSNGVGKSSLFKLILAELETDKGELELPSNLRITQIRQEIPAGSQSALAYVLAGNQALSEVLDKLAKAEAKDDGMLMAECHTKLAELDGYSAESQAAKVLVGLGFLQTDLHRALDDFSGGWRMRLNLAQVLLAPSDLLLLDEPTNHLDLEAIFWLEDWLRQTSTTTLVISHDREFLDNVVNRILFIKDQLIHSFNGDYSTFEAQYALQLELQQATFIKQQKHISHMMKFVDKNRAKASKAKQAQSRLKAIERMEKVEAVHLSNPFNFAFKPAMPAGNPMLTLRKVDIGYGEEAILKQVSLSIHPGDRLALLGLNGAGKSTLIKALARKNDVVGEQVFNPKIRLGYFTQHQVDSLNQQQDALWHMHQLSPTLSEKEARSFLGSFNFSDERVFEPVHHFSGGEKARLALALLVWQEPNLLLLDEPTNHLDLEMRQALIMALQNFEGALIVVAHDQYLLENLAEQYLLVKDGRVSYFDGDLNDYNQQVVNNSSEQDKQKQLPKKAAAVKNTDWQQRYDKLEAELEKCQQKLIKLNEELCEALNDEIAYAAKLQQQQQCQLKLNKIEAELLQALDNY